MRLGFIDTRKLLCIFWELHNKFNRVKLVVNLFVMFILVVHPVETYLLLQLLTVTTRTYVSNLYWQWGLALTFTENFITKLSRTILKMYSIENKRLFFCVKLFPNAAHRGKFWFYEFIAPEGFIKIRNSINSILDL